MSYPRRIKFMTEWLSAGMIAKRHGLSTPTIIKRHAMGLRDKDLVAPAYSLPAAPDGKAFKYRSKVLPSPARAKFYLRRALRAVELAQGRLAHARALRENKATIARLDRALHRAEVRRMVCAEMVRRLTEKESVT